MSTQPTPGQTQFEHLKNTQLYTIAGDMFPDFLFDSGDVGKQEVKGRIDPPNNVPNNDLLGNFYKATTTGDKSYLIGSEELNTQVNINHQILLKFPDTTMRTKDRYKVVDYALANKGKWIWVKYGDQIAFTVADKGNSQKLADLDKRYTSVGFKLIHRGFMPSDLDPSTGEKLPPKPVQRSAPSMHGGIQTSVQVAIAKLATMIYDNWPAYKKQFSDKDDAIKEATDLLHINPKFDVDKFSDDWVYDELEGKYHTRTRTQTALDLPFSSTRTETSQPDGSLKPGIGIVEKEALSNSMTITQQKKQKKRKATGLIETTRPSKKGRMKLNSTIFNF